MTCTHWIRFATVAQSLTGHVGGCGLWILAARETGQVPYTGLRVTLDTVVLYCRCQIASAFIHSQCFAVNLKPLVPHLCFAGNSHQQRKSKPCPLHVASCCGLLAFSLKNGVGMRCKHQQPKKLETVVEYVLLLYTQIGTTPQVPWQQLLLEVKLSRLLPCSLNSHDGTIPYTYLYSTHYSHTVMMLSFYGWHAVQQTQHWNTVQTCTLLQQGTLLHGTAEYSMVQ